MSSARMSSTRMSSEKSSAQLKIYNILDDYLSKDMEGRTYTSMTPADRFNTYVRRSMWEQHEQPTWIVHAGDINIPIVAEVRAANIDHSRKKIRKLAYSEFNCKQCKLNCEKLLSIFGPAGPFLCKYDNQHSKYTAEMYSVAQETYTQAFKHEHCFTLTIATDDLLTKNKFAYVGPSDTAAEITEPYFHYAGNCETLEKIESKKIKMFNFALKKYWLLIHNLIVKLTNDWNQAGRRHATKQLINTIKDTCKNITYAEAHFGETFTWILKILHKFCIPFKQLPMNDRIQIVASAIYEGNINYDGNGDESVVHFQYSQMNNTITMLMKKAINKSELIKIIKSLVDPANKGRKKSLETPSLNQITKAESILGENFWTRVATNKSLCEYYKTYTGTTRFWQSPLIYSGNSTGAKSGFDSLRCDAVDKRKSHSHIEHDANSIPDLIKLLVMGKSIYIPVNYEHAVIAHTSIDHENLICKPVEDNGGLMWSFLGGIGFGTNTQSVKISKNNKMWKRLIAVHYLEAGVYSNYILITEKSSELPAYLTQNVVLGEWCFSSKVVRHIGHVVSQIRSKTKLMCSSEEEYNMNGEYPIIGVGVCSGPNGMLSHGHQIPYLISETPEKKHLNVSGTIKYFKEHKVYDKKSIYMPNKYCTNCGAPIGKKTPPPNFCGNCGRKL